MKNKLLDKIYISYCDSYNSYKNRGENLFNINDVSFYYVEEPNKSVFYNSLSAVSKEDREKITQEFADCMPNKNVCVYYKNKTLFDEYFIISFFGSDSETLHVDLYSNENDSLDRLVKKSPEDAKKHVNLIVGVLLKYLKKVLTDKDTYIAKDRIVVKKKSGLPHPIDICHISTKKNIKQYEKKNNLTNIEWFHSWKVIGHWRTIKGIGKSREGNYDVVGKTWVNPCIKGDGPLIEKIRVIKGDV